MIKGAVPTTHVGTAVLKIIVGTTVPTMIARTKLSLTVVPTTFVKLLFLQMLLEQQFI